MKSEIISNLIEKAIDAGTNGTYELSDIYYELDEMLETEGKDAVIREFFDCWADAVNHDYMAYKSREPKVWIQAAQELKEWYVYEDMDLSPSSLWLETIRNGV